MKQPTVGIIGYGMVGKAVGAWFKKAAIYSLHQYRDGLEKVNAADVVFLTVPTPYSARAGYSLSALEHATKRITGKKIVVLKSTVLPGTTVELQCKYPQHTWLFNPEFLRDATNVWDFLHPDRQIIGMPRNTAKHRKAAKLVMRMLPKAPYEAITTSTEAELIKLGANCFLATKIVYANMLYDLCKRTGSDYEQVKNGIGNDPRITTSMMKVGLDGYRGYHKKCFPKDMSAMIWYGKKTKHRLALLETADAINWKLLPKRLRYR